MPARDVQRRAEGDAPGARAIRIGATWLGLVAAFAAGAGAGWLGARAAGPPVSADAQPPAAGAGRAAEPEGILRDRVLTLEPFIVNLLGEDASRYLKVRIELEARSEVERAGLEDRMPQVRDAVLSVLSAHDVVDVTSVEGKTLLKHELLERVNALRQDEPVRAVLFTEFVVQ